MLRPRWMAHSAVAIAVVLLSAGMPSVEAQAKPSPSDFLAFLDQADAAQLELQNGKPAAYQALWSHADDVTLSGGLGGQIEKGWEAVSKRLDWVGTQFSQGTNRIERTVEHASGDFGYLVQAEHLRYRVPTTGAETTRDYRVTMVFRRESGAWKIVHRQADSNLVKQGGQ